MTSSDSLDPQASLRLAVIVPAYNEAGVIERRLRNLLLSAWPEGSGHQLIVVDDQSSDDTARRARELFETTPIPDGVAVDVAVSEGRAGKPSALRTGLARAQSRGAYDLAVVTDADVITAPDALLRLCQAFHEDASLAIACASQRFVQELCDSGQVQAPDAQPLVPAGGSYDRLTAGVRRLESRFGRLFSLHGQLMAWRQNLEIIPRAGIAADDLDLVLQLAQRPLGPGEPWSVRMLAGALFYETKTPAGPGAEQQALRRARAYVQVLRSSRPPQRDVLSKLHWSLYRFLPIWAPELAACALASVLLASWLWSPWAMTLAFCTAVAAIITPVGKRWLSLMSVIRRARRLESSDAQPERWEMAR